MKLLLFELCLCLEKMLIFSGLHSNFKFPSDFTLVSGRMDTFAALILCHVFLFFYEGFFFSCLVESSPSHRIQKQTVPELVPLSTREGLPQSWDLVSDSCTVCGYLEPTFWFELVSKYLLYGFIYKNNDCMFTGYSI